MRFYSILFLFLFGSVYLRAENLRGTVCSEDNAPISGANISIRTAKDDKVVATTYTADNGTFVLYDIEAGRYTLSCTYVGYLDYTAEVQVAKGSNLDLGRLVMYIENVQIDEVAVVADRNVFTTEKQYIYPSEQQVEKSSGGLDLLQKLPIPLLDVNPISRTVSSLDPTGGVALLINDIPADANDISILDPKQVKRIEVIRSPGMMYGANLAMAINVVMKKTQDGVALGVNATNSTKITYGYNNVFATYNRKNSQLTINQSENYQNFSNQTSDDLRQYLLPNGDWHTVHIQSLSARTLSATHGTTLKYNLTLPDNLVFQAQGYLNLRRNPRQERSYLVSETGKSDYTSHIRSKDQNESPALNLYLKKYLANNQALIFNVVGTHINSDYDYLYELEESGFQTAYGVRGQKSSIIGEVKYNKSFQWGSLTSGIRSFYGNTRNHYVGSTDNSSQMVNVNSNAYVQVDGRWKQLSGSASLSLDDQYYNQKDGQYHKQILNPQVNLNYWVSSTTSLGYRFSLAPRLPSLASMNDIIIQKDQWERSVGNPFLKPFNHIENTLRAAYYKANVYALLSATYASNRHAIMPTVTRTEIDGQVFFDNEAQNQRDMNQLVLTAYLRYAAFNNKLIVSGTGSYNHFHAKSYLYTNKRGFFSGNIALESYLGKFYLSARCASRYNSLFAETIWYNEYTSSLNATYNWKNFKIGVTWEQPLQPGGTNNRVETLNDVVHKVVRQSNPEAGNHFLLTLSWRWNHGFKPKIQEADLNNKDTDAGILK